MFWRRKTDPIAEYRADLDRQVAEAEAARSSGPPDMWNDIASHMNAVTGHGGWVHPTPGGQ